MACVEFLQAFHPTGFWVLTAIRADRKGIETRTFASSGTDDENVRAWVLKLNRTHNIYFSVNQPLCPLSKKAERGDIATVRYLHVDIDARVGESLDEELARIRALLEAFTDPRPTCVVMSGGGYQAFWRLMEPLEVGGDVARCEEAALYNKQLELRLGGDNCSNVDRVMRLPGTTNIPNAKKASRGRLPVMAGILWLDDTSYPIARFTKAPKLQGEHAELDQDMPSGNVERLASVDDLDRWKVPERVKVVVVQGYDPDNPKEGDNSRSAWLFDACCGMARAGVPDKVIFAVITDPHFSISASVLDKGANADRYATRQIQRAKDDVEEPWLRRLNDRHLVVGNVGGKCRVMEELPDPATGRTALSFQSFGDLRNRYSNVYLSVGKRQVPLGQWWLGSPRRRQAETVVFTPGRTPPGAYNLWQGFACHALPGTAHESYLAHARDNICSGVPEHYSYLLGWMARTAQRPNLVGETAVVLRGKSGVGKSFFVQQFGSLFGRHFIQVSDAKHLVGSFNMHLRDCVVLFGDEAFYAGDRRHESVLKTLVTSPEINIEGKGLDVVTQPNYIHLLMASNADWVVPTGPMERRFLVLDVADTHMQDNPYFTTIARGMGAGGREALLYHLLNYDLKDFDVYAVPHTAALSDQKLHTLDQIHEWWLDRLHDGTLLGTGTVDSQDLLDDYLRYCVQFNVTRRSGGTKLGRFLRRMCPDGWPRRRRTGDEARKYHYQLPPLPDLRDHWDSLMGTCTDWNDEENVAVSPTDQVPF